MDLPGKICSLSKEIRENTADMIVGYLETSLDFDRKQNWRSLGAAWEQHM
jgi:hypothetical protein